jgi:hypothetical protein
MLELTGKKQRLLVIGTLLAAGAILVAVVFFVPATMARNAYMVRILSAAIHDRYPTTDFRIWSSYQDYRIFIYVHSITDPAVQLEMKNWLADLKSNRGISGDIWLEFWSDAEEDERLSVFKLD